MTNDQWKAFSDFRAELLAQCDSWARRAGGAGGWLANLQKEAAEADRNPSYPLENPVVYNRALDDLAPTDDIRLIVVGDNPGKDEQLTKNRRYLVGQAGKLAEGFFRSHPELGIDFRKNVVILNKTPVHTAKTRQLTYVLRSGGREFGDLFGETQTWMADRTLALAAALGIPVWLVGYGELKAKGLFAEYGRRLAEGRSTLATSGKAPPEVLVFQHFSMNRFSIDLKERYNPAEDLGANLLRIGLGHRKEILGW